MLSATDSYASDPTVTEPVGRSPGTILLTELF